MANENTNGAGQVEPVEPVEKVEPVELDDDPVELDEVTSDAHCPNCNGPGIRKGKTILCQVCDASFRYTKEGPKVEELGPFDKLEDRVTKLEGGHVARRFPMGEPETAQPAEPETAQPAEPISAQPAEPEDDGI